MFNKLRWKLTAFNTVITSAIMVCLVLLCLTFSEQNTKDQTLRNFTDTVYAVSSYLEVQDQISDTWLRQMEADPNIHISVLDAGKPLFSLTLSPEKEYLDLCFRRQGILQNCQVMRRLIRCFPWKVIMPQYTGSQRMIP